MTSHDMTDVEQVCERVLFLFAIGVMNTRRIDAWSQGEDPASAAPLREQAYFWRPLGRDYDPRRAIIKDTPGPLLIHEFDMEISV